MPTPRPNSTRTLTHGDVLANVISGLEVLQAASTVIANIPFVGSIVNGALGLAKTIERVTGTKDRYLRLARRAVDLSTHIEKSLEPDPHAMEGNLRTNLIEIHVLLTRIQTDVDRQLRRKPLTRFLHQSSIATTLDDHIDALDSAWRAFDTACLIALRKKMERQALYDDHTQLRLFRWSDLKCLKVRGKYRVSCYDVGEEWEGDWNGRAVVVRTIKPSRSEADFTSLVRYYPDLHHPYVAQVIGYSHPALSDRFYVMDAGVIPLIDQFRGKDVFDRLLNWLQHVTDYQSAFHYLEERGFPVNESHRHDHSCLPSAMLNEEGKLIIEASDFCNSNLGCFQARVRMLCDEDLGVLSPGEDYANDGDLSSHASALLIQLRGCMEGRKKLVDVEPFIRSDLANIWASHQFQGNVNGKWSDYGFITRNGATETFVPLGNIYDLVTPTGKITTFILRRGSGQDWRPAEEYPWSADVVCHTFERAEDAENCIEDIAVVRTLPDDSEYHEFFWNHSEDIAAQHGLAVHDIVLYEEIFYYAGVIFDDGLDSPVSDSCGTLDSHDGKSRIIPSKLYFHQLPLLSSNDAPTPWGYWSLDPEPIPGPWPLLEIPGVTFTCRLQPHYVRVSSFEADMLVFLNNLRRNRNLVKHRDSHLESESSRFEELS